MKRMGDLRRRHGAFLGHWGMEILVVTVGVLIALGVQQWAEGQGARRRSAEADERIRHELLANALILLEWVAISPCLVRRLAVLRDGVVLGGDGWRPALIPNWKDETRIMARVYAVPIRAHEKNAFVGAASNGDLAAMSPERLSAITELYKTMDLFTELNREEGRLAVGLSPLQYIGAQGAQQRAAVLTDLARLDAANSIVSLNTAYVLRSISALGYRVAPGEVAAARARWNQQVADGRILLGRCHDRRAADALYRSLLIAPVR